MEFGNFFIYVLNTIFVKCADNLTLQHHKLFTYRVSYFTHGMYYSHQLLALMADIVTNISD